MREKSYTSPIHPVAAQPWVILCRMVRVELTRNVALTCPDAHNWVPPSPKLSVAARSTVLSMRANCVTPISSSHRVPLEKIVPEKGR